MLRRLAFCLPLALVVAACGGGDDSPDAATTVETLAPATTIVVPDGSDACEDAPDPADYEATVPVVRRPCELPTEVTTTVVVDGVGYAAEPGDGVIYQVTAIDASDGSLIGSTWTTGQPTNIPQIALGATPDTTVPGSTDATTPTTTPSSVPATEGTLDEELIGAQVGARIRIDVPAGTPGAGALFGGATVPAETPVTYVIEPVVVVPPLVAADSPRDLTIAPSVDATEVTFVDPVVGDGKVVELGDTAVVAMMMLRGDNEVVLFDSWYQGQPLVISLLPELMGGAEPATLPGVFEGLQGARVGGTRVISMPPEDAFGADGRPLLGLPPNTDVIVVAEILGAY
ncbi:MAG: FKBP-type peptidyl-prolyl cis-trans isomerase [Ilumatobacter sp.]|nr:FKBP-type peptidyl-prolyl cis-trans isomerase [Ilumatobacter sp.]